MVKVLKLKFKGSLGKNSTLKIAYPKNDLSKDVVGQAAQKIAQSQIFVKDGERKMDQPVGAEMVSTTTETILNTEDFASFN